jgi:curved DNA-binding protein CbpA
MFMIDLGVDSHYSLLGVSPDATAAQIRQARDSLIRELRERQRREPARREELTERQRLINNVGEELARPAKRAQYDKDHEHLRFFTIRSATAPMFTDPQDRIDVLHRVISAHLRRAGVHIRPLSDLDRGDFTADVTPNSLLDELIGQS